MGKRKGNTSIIVIVLITTVIAFGLFWWKNSQPNIARQEKAVVQSQISKNVPAKPSVAPPQTISSNDQVGENDRYKVMVIDRQDQVFQHESATVEIFDKSTQKLSTISGRLRVFAAVEVVWDPLGKYILLSSGTYVTTQIVVISLTSLKQVADTFCAGLGPKFWNNFVIYTNCVDPQFGTNDIPAILALNLTTGKVTTIAAIDKQTSLRTSKIEGNTLFYSKKVFQRLPANNFDSEDRGTYDLNTLQ